VTIRARLGDDGVHHFEVNHNFEGNDFRLLSCNIGGVPKKASCHPDLAKAVRSRKDDPDASHGLIFAALAHFTTCAQKLAADMNDGDETFQIGVGKGQKSLRQAVTTLGMTKVEKAGMYEFLHAQELFERRADQRVADASRSRSKARR
jgi:hypothetical protein